jgi:hypothetical protein
VYLSDKLGCLETGCLGGNSLTKKTPHIETFGLYPGERRQEAGMGLGVTLWEVISREKGHGYRNKGR